MESQSDEGSSASHTRIAARAERAGAQSALLAARIAVAADAGCTVLATETGESISGEKNPSLDNIRRAGFEQVCSRLNLAPKR